MKPGQYVEAAATISHQPTFCEKHFFDKLLPLQRASELIQPVYKQYIDPLQLRRMSKILRMGVACSLEALKQAGLKMPSGIIVGTGLGCLQDTEKFLNNFLTLEGLLPPTAFILSTHNTIAGQISLTLGCHGYNVTHTQNTLSFEVALMDALMKLEEGQDSLLVGAADECIPFLENVAQAWGYADRPLASGSSFFVLSSSVSANSLAEVKDVTVYVGEREDNEDIIAEFLSDHRLTAGDIDWVLVTDQRHSEKYNRVVPYLPLSGLYSTASAFAFHYAVDYLRAAEGLKRVLIINELNSGSLGLTLLQSIET